MADQKQVSFQHRARFCLEGDHVSPKHIWFVLHGYGQLSEYFIRKFSAVLGHKNSLVVAPEGLSRFYLEGFSGRVGATWMTKEDRQNDIENNINYLNAVYQQVMSMVENPSVKVTILGFSQGAATAARWALHQSAKFDRLILWAGVFPDDMDIEVGNNLLKEKDVKLVSGTLDPFLTPDRIKKQNELLSKLSFKPEMISFAGGHDIDQKTLLTLL